MEEDMHRKGPHALAPGEYFMECPYDQHHIVTNHRILYHLQKCRKNYAKAQHAKGLSVEYGVCKFNYVHHVPLIELLFHERRCEDQFSALKYIDYHASPKFVQFKSETVAHFKQQEEDLSNKMEELQMQGKLEVEDWESAVEKGTSYNPSSRLASRPLLYAPKTLTKSERTEFRTDHRKRFARQLQLGGQGGQGRTKFVISKTGTAEGSEVKYCESESSLPPTTECDGSRVYDADLSSNWGSHTKSSKGASTFLGNATWRNQNLSDQSITDAESSARNGDISSTASTMAQTERNCLKGYYDDSSDEYD